MDWILLFCSIVIILISYTIIKKGKNLEKRITAEPAAEPLSLEGKPLALIFGFSELGDALIALLRSYDIDFLQITDQSQLDSSKEYTHLFAISESDLENLLINTLVNRINKTHKKIAVCNIPDNSVIYRQSGIQSLSSDNIDAEQLFRVMFPSSAGMILENGRPITAKG